MDKTLRAADAERILNEPLLQQALQAIKDEIIAQWSATPARDTEGREWIWRHLKVAEKFENLLRGYLADGKIEAFNQRQSPLDKVTQFMKGRP